MDQLNNSVNREAAGGDVNMRARDEEPSEEGSLEGRGRGRWRHAAPGSVGYHPAHRAVAATRRLFNPEVR